MRSSIATLSAAALLPLHVLAAPTTIGFAGMGFGNYETANFTIDGYRFSPSCHVDHRNVALASDGATLAWDADSCDTVFNPNYLGLAPNSPGIGELYIDRGGKPFDLISFVGIAPSLFDGAIFTSSSGGFQKVDLPVDSPTKFTFTGVEWEDLQWVRILNGGGDPNWDLDSITLRAVPEPASWALVALAGIGMATARRKRQP